MKDKKRVYIYPYYSRNRYIDKFKNILSRSFDVLELPKGINIFNKVYARFRLDILVLNWFEDKNSRSTLRFFWGVMYLLVLRLAFNKLIWVRHNFKPHGHTNLIKYKLICILLDHLSNKKITHRPINGYDYLPHPLYNFDGLLSPVDGERCIDYLIFGKIKPYKGIEFFLANWPVNKHLKIIGECSNEKLREQITGIIQDRNLDVDFVNKYISDRELDDILKKTKRIILPHLDDTMIVSGAFYHAATFGANVLVRNNKCFFSYLLNEFSFVSVFHEESELVPNYVMLDELNNKLGDNLIYEKFCCLTNS